MINPYVAKALAAEHHNDMIKAAQRHRLIALARCCKPSNIAAAARTLRSRLTRPGATKQCCA